MKGFLVLETGEVFEGLWHGGEPRAGEVVFNTSHAGYEEIASDPSYFMQIMVMTAPMQGNYGSFLKDRESSRLWIQGFVCLEIDDRGVGAAWREELLKANIPILSEVSTRKLVLRLRDEGTPWGALLNAASVDEAKANAKELIAREKVRFTKEVSDWTRPVARVEPELLKGSRAGGPRLAVLDFGIKNNILNHLKEQTSELIVVPGYGDLKKVREWDPNAIILSNGPGDPAEVKSGTENIRSLLGWKPMFGICMGHQTLSLALGGSTFKLRFGHRGGNHPVQDDLLKRIYITSQNHGYAVKPESLPSDVTVTHRNLYDGTVEGIECQRLKCLSVQFHPESAPGPHDAAPLFRLFMERWL